MGDYTPIYWPGKTITGRLSAAVTGGQVLGVSGTGVIAPTTGATAAVVGVAAQDAPSGALVAYFTGGVQELVASGTVTAGDTVVSAAAGQVATQAAATTALPGDINNSRAIIGVALTTATTGNKCRVEMTR